MRLIYFLFSHYSFLVHYQLEIHVFVLKPLHTPVVNASFVLGSAHIAVARLSHLHRLESVQLYVRFLGFFLQRSDRRLLIHVAFDTVLLFFTSSHIRWLK